MNSSESPARRGSLVWQLVEKLDEQRQYPRIPIDGGVRIFSADGEEVPVLALNVSPDGLQLRCDIAAARQLHPAGGRVDPMSDVLFKADITLPLAAGAAHLECDCRLLYLTTVDSEPRCVIGMRFVDLNQRAERLLTAFLCDQMGMDAATAA